ncbi:hypothetical protein [Flavobacterium cerinum]|uniref:Uncharacterized protein n=1 Tax=Flavobacterium cerinum TaxID=2502784 RepID=A0A444HD30_9FLAO|nr:hypothetical protein [Flavobacterium cerinum]RWX01582.1 hypothetical protein EPI11_06425 [Flavobacterium cerinum]
MTHFTARFEDNKCIIHNGTAILGVIQFEDKRRIVASLILENTIFSAHPASSSDKNIVITANDAILLKFKFDYLWGGASLYVYDEPTGYKITGKAFKPGSRLVDIDGNDLIVVVNASKWSENQGLKMEVIDTQVTAFQIITTVYYHLYTSASKLYSMVGIV